MLWVVIGHAGPSPTLDDFPVYALALHKFAYSFHMQLFIMVSGFLFYLTRIDNEKWKYWPMLKEKLLRFGIPFVVFTLIALLLKNVFAGSVDRATSLSVGELVNAILYPYNGPMREFWFLATIMCFFALYPLWKVVLQNSILIVMTFLTLGALSIWQPNCDFLAIRHVCSHAFYFFAGVVCASLYKRNPSVIMSSRVAFLSLAIGVILYTVGMLWSIPLITPLGGALFSLSIALWLEKVYPKCFWSFRDYTYQIYLMGIFFNVIVSILRTKFGWPFGPMYIVSALLGLYMPVVISKCLEWLNWKALLLCVGLRPMNKQ